MNPFQLMFFYLTASNNACFSVIFSTGRFCWVFGMLEVKGASRLLVLKMVRDRSRNTLMPLIRKHIRRGSTVYSDCWRAYEPALNVEGYRHLSVNHREHFVDPLTGCHTQHIERAWQTIKLQRQQDIQTS